MVDAGGEVAFATVVGALYQLATMFTQTDLDRLDRLLQRRGPITRAGLIDLLVNFPVGVGLGLALGWTPIEAVVLGGIVYISSSAVITKSLIDLGWIANAESEPILGTLVFEDLVNVHDRDLQRLLTEVDQQDLVYALKAAPEELKDKILSNVSQRVANGIREELELTGRVRVGDVEDAQRAIIETAQRLEDNEEIMLTTNPEEMIG